MLRGLLACTLLACSPSSERGAWGCSATQLTGPEIRHRALASPYHAAAAPLLLETGVDGHYAAREILVAGAREARGLYHALKLLLWRELPDAAERIRAR